MAFEKFLGAQFESRTRAIAVSADLQGLLELEEPEWIVRGLTAAEKWRCSIAADANTGKSVQALALALTGDGDVSEKAELIRKAIGISSEEVPADVRYRIEILSVASVTPELGEMNRDVAVLLAEVAPDLFQRLTDAITNLTSLGAEPGKRKPSGKKRKSG